jgi:hypothetical protein
MVLILFHPAILSVFAVLGFGSGANSGHQRSNRPDSTHSIPRRRYDEKPVTQSLRTMTRFPLLAILLSVTFSAGIVAGHTVRPAGASAAAARVFELRTYTSPPGKLPALHRRFREHTMELFARHGMTNVAYWTPQDSARRENTLVYLLAYPSRQAARDSWAAFSADPEWQRVRAESEANGKIVEKVESVFLDPTDFSPMK